MKAAVYTRYGKPEVVSIQTLPIPVPKNNEVLVKVYASTVNRTDAGFRSAEYIVSRFWSGLLKPKLPVLGSEFAGVIENVGALVRKFKVGDKVFGFNDKTFGGHAEYLCIAEEAGMALMPATFDFDTAAALTEGSHYALNDIRATKIKAGEQAMVYGATGAIGSAAVQLLKYYGVHVTAVCNTKNIALVKSLGADVVIDYQTQDYTKTTTKFQFIFDAVGKSSFKICKPLLTEKGIYISTELGKYGANIWQAMLTPLWGGKKVLFPIPTMTKADAELIKTMAEQGAFKPIIDRTYPLDQIHEAYHYVESGQKTGNVILHIFPPH